MKEAGLVASANTAKEVTYNPVPLAKAKEALPFSFQAPSFLPYTSSGDTKAVIRKGGASGKEQIVLNVKYNRSDGQDSRYVELTVANFEYSMQLVQQKLFDEAFTLSDGTQVYYKGIKEGGDEFATLTWKRGSMDYQLLYRNVRDQDNSAVKQALLQVANSMKA
ncbi:DNA polymerase III subunit delta [Ectobacillus sp. SYSU M60031]|uniref:DNA polymerase III subunit delta n=1 Tax=Ectobacillus ponti TaxID=2961894 RepID=A0AA41X809_9BACI|nr:DNA polymerase III subunit delta [Ectobacillus ponti]